VTSRKPLPWSYSALDDFKNCPRAYYEKKVAKSVKEEPSEQMIWGNKVHKHFEDRQKFSTPLPEVLAEHEPFMQELEDLTKRPGVTVYTEGKIALNKRLQPCGFFDKDVWWRGVIDWAAHDGKTGRMVDYKTGKPHQKYEQLAMFAIHLFTAAPTLQRVDVEFYWTKTQTSTAKSFERAKIAELWGLFTPDLKQYVEAFKTDTWQPRQSGLCAGWCPVKDCEFWRPKKVR